MLYKIITPNGTSRSLEPQPYDRLPNEEDLEDFLADHLIPSLQLLPMHRKYGKGEGADIYALNSDGNLAVFSIQRQRTNAVGDGFDQILKYINQSTTWDYNDIARIFKIHATSKSKTTTGDLAIAHQRAFFLDEPLDKDRYNRKQHLMLVGYPAKDKLIDKINLWQDKGINIQYMPYQVYQLRMRAKINYLTLGDIT